MPIVLQVQYLVGILFLCVQLKCDARFLHKSICCWHWWWGVSSSYRIAKESGATTESFVSKYPALVTGFFFFAWYVWLAPQLLMTCVLVLVNNNPYKGHPYWVGESISLRVLQILQSAHKTDTERERERERVLSECSDGKTTKGVLIICSCRICWFAKWMCTGRYFLNVIFNIMNKKLYNYFPYP
jgi:hypothetical protein